MKNIIITIAAVLTLIGCSPEEQTGYEQSISNILTSEAVWLADLRNDDAGNELRFGYAFKDSDSGSLEYKIIADYTADNNECLQLLDVDNTTSVDVYRDRIVITLEGNQSFTLTMVGNLLKMSTDQGDILFKAESGELLCGSW
jgi:hypothetical protein